MSLLGTPNGYPCIKTLCYKIFQIRFPFVCVRGVCVSFFKKIIIKKKFIDFNVVIFNKTKINYNVMYFNQHLSTKNQIKKNPNYEIIKH